MIIKGKDLEPFFISVEDNQLVLKEIRKPDPNNPLTKDVDREYEIVHGYFTSFEILINRLIQIKLAQQQAVVTLKEFLTQLKEESAFLTSLINSLRNDKS